MEEISINLKRWQSAVLTTSRWGEHLPEPLPMWHLRKGEDFFSPLCFLYFFTLHADTLQYVVGGFGIRLNNLLGLMLTILLFFRYGRALFSYRKEVLLPLIFFTLSSLLSLLFSPYKERCIIFFFWYGFTLINYFFLPYQLLQKFPTQKILSLYFLSYLATELLILFELPRFVTSHFTLRPHAFTLEPSYYALYLTPFLVMTTWRYLYQKEISGYTLCVIYTLFFLSCSTLAFVSYLLLLFTLIFLLFLPSFKLFRKETFFFVTTSLGSLALPLLLFPSYVFRIMAKILLPSFFLHHGSFLERYHGLKETWAIFREHPFVGIGFGAIPLYRFEKWQASPTGDVEGILANLRPFKHFEPANVATEFLASFGLVGLFSLFLFLGSFGYLAYKAKKKESLGTLSFFFSTLIMLIVLQINQGLLRTYFWVHIALSYSFFDKVLTSKE